MSLWDGFRERQEGTHHLSAFLIQDVERRNSAALWKLKNNASSARPQVASMRARFAHLSGLNPAHTVEATSTASFFACTKAAKAGGTRNVCAPVPSTSRSGSEKKVGITVVVPAPGMDLLGSNAKQWRA